MSDKKAEKQKLYQNLYYEGQRARKENKPRFAPYIIVKWALKWFAGYDNAEKDKSNEK